MCSPCAAPCATPSISGPETGKRKRVTRRADGKQLLSVNLGVALARKADAFGYPFQLTNFSLPVSGPLTRESARGVRCEAGETRLPRRGGRGDSRDGRPSNPLQADTTLIRTKHTNQQQMPFYVQKKQTHRNKSNHLLCANINNKLCPGRPHLNITYATVKLIMYIYINIYTHI